MKPRTIVKRPSLPSITESVLEDTPNRKLKRASSSNVEFRKKSLSYIFGSKTNLTSSKTTKDTRLNLIFGRDLKPEYINNGLSQPLPYLGSATRETLMGILRDPIERADFRAYLARCLCEELLDFWVEVDNFRSSPNYEVGECIFTRYVAKDSLQLINVETFLLVLTRRDWENKLALSPEEFRMIFKRMQVQVFDTMLIDRLGSYIKFKRLGR